MQSSISPTEPRPALTTATDNSLNVASNSVHASRKRKSGDLDNDRDGSQQRDTTFVAKLLSATGTISFTPVTLVARACLPLSWLDTPHPTARLLFNAAILSVEEWEQRVLIVRKVPNGGLYAVEQVTTDAYVGVALHGWVSEEWCRTAAIGNVPQVRLEDLLPASEDSVQRSHSRTASGSSSTALPTPKSPKRPKNRRGALARMSILAQKSPADLESMVERDELPTPSQMPNMTPSLVQEPLPITPAAQATAQNPFEVGATSSEPGPAELQPMSTPLQVSIPVPDTAEYDPLAPERLRMQYFEHLYTSKTSLAFYVKGPLSRARAHVRTAEDAAKAISDLSDFYKASILATKRVDLKYKESVSSVIRELPILQRNEGDGPVDANEPKKKKARKKKMKLGKDSLWPEEDDFIAKWWRGRDVKGTVSSTGDQSDDMRREMGDLRMRETKMQMLLILEVMLLEMAAAKLAETDKPGIPADPNVKVESVEEDSTAAILAMTPHKGSKKEKSRDWSAEIDTLVDRLCIWHTVSIDDIADIVDKTSKKDANGSSAAKPNDSLREFCKDVLLPFYSAKLPEQIKAIYRKLGGPEPSPKRPSKPAHAPPPLHKSSSSTSSIPKVKPGQVLSKRTLERVLSEDQQLLRHASPPTTFSRASSITAPILPTLKREPSERPLSRGGMLSKSASFSNREIDLVADQKVHEAKRRKLDRLARQKRELEAAIDALKKPDRKAVAGQIMDEVEERKRLEREKRTAVQISATPRSRRVAGNMHVMEEPELPPMPRLVVQEQEAALVIPSSTVKPHLRSGLSSSASMPRSSATKRAVLAAIHETPSRGFGMKTSNPLDLPAAPITIAATPISKRATSDREALPSSELNLPSSQPQPSSSQGTATAQGLHMSRSRRPVLFTPIKKSEARLDQIFRDAPEIPEQAGRMMDRVMGGKGRGIDDGFELPQINHSLRAQQRDVDEQQPGRSSMMDGDDGDIYEKLGWNEDFDL